MDSVKGILDKSNYKDLGLIVDESAVVDGGFAWSDTILNCEGANQMIFKTKSTQAYELYITRINSSNISDWSSLIINGLGATGSGSFAGIVKSGDLVSVGHSFKIGMKNVAGDTNTALMQCYLEVKN